MNRQGDVESLETKDGEIHDLSPTTFRFIAVLMVAAAVLMVAGVL